MYWQGAELIERKSVCELYCYFISRSGSVSIESICGVVGVVWLSVELLFGTSGGGSFFASFIAQADHL